MVTLTSADIMALLKKNGLEPDKVEFEVVERLREKNLKVATCGVCSYANEIKEKLLGVRHDTLSILGAVSAETAIQMAEGVKKLSGADITVSVTGIAGPSGGTSEKPVGLVFLGICSETDAYAVKLLLGEDNERDYIRAMASTAALFIVLEEVHKYIVIS